MRRISRPTLFVVALQVTSLLVVASGLFVILISDINRNMTTATKIEPRAHVQLDASPGWINAR